MTELERLQAENARLRAANKILLGDDDNEYEEEFDESQLEIVDNASNKAEGKSAK